MADKHNHTTLWRRSAWLALAVVLLTLPVLNHWYQGTQSDMKRQSGQQDEPPIWPLPEDETEARKARLVNLLLPAIQNNNRKLLEKRARLMELHKKIQDNQPLSRDDKVWLEELSRRYRLDLPEQPSSDWSRVLLRRIDIVPADLALAQGALESAWGTSRFAVEGNNYFGHWCFVPGCGLVPQQRLANARHEVARFSSPAESVRRYMHNLNSHPRYTELRLLREEARRQEQSFSGSDLAAGLEGYSELGEEYIGMVRGLIRQNQFERFSDY
ncbi:glucosaminidase domain-containing protein [Alcanivorax sp. 1008]|uniref:glucosaminidase domain-containing protein n=1 Tax=Alcanivorax sp. 1008 TaxID=2816853 RepID=UPI001D8412B8|nr:glucosaminidase domain-containing protein [Alcanivorax sp. 1008]MCC1495750.1 glucosaminidase domain-containing protein [Alcanivorax sp. 1008]